MRNFASTKKLNRQLFTFGENYCVLGRYPISVIIVSDGNEGATEREFKIFKTKRKIVKSNVLER